MALVASCAAVQMFAVRSAASLKTASAGPTLQLVSSRCASWLIPDMFGRTGSYELADLGVDAHVPGTSQGPSPMLAPEELGEGIELMTYAPFKRVRALHSCTQSWEVLCIACSFSA